MYWWKLKSRCVFVKGKIQQQRTRIWVGKRERERASGRYVNDGVFFFCFSCEFGRMFWINLIAYRLAWLVLYHQFGKNNSIQICDSDNCNVLRIQSRISGWIEYRPLKSHHANIYITYICISNVIEMHLDVYVSSWSKRHMFTGCTFAHQRNSKQT